MILRGPTTTKDTYGRVVRVYHDYVEVMPTRKVPASAQGPYKQDMSPYSDSVKVRPTVTSSLPSISGCIDKANADMRPSVWQYEDYLLLLFMHNTAGSILTPVITPFTSVPQGALRYGKEPSWIVVEPNESDPPLPQLNRSEMLPRYDKDGVPMALPQLVKLSRSDITLPSRISTSIARLMDTKIRDVKWWASVQEHPFVYPSFTILSLNTSLLLMDKRDNFRVALHHHLLPTTTYNRRAYSFDKYVDKIAEPEDSLVAFVFSVSHPMLRNMSESPSFASEHSVGQFLNLQDAQVKFSQKTKRWKKNVDAIPALKDVEEGILSFLVDSGLANKKVARTFAHRIGAQSLIFINLVHVERAGEPSSFLSEFFTNLNRLQLAEAVV